MHIGLVMTKNQHEKVSKAIDAICDIFEENGGADRESITDALFDLAGGSIHLEEVIKENM